MAIIGKIWSGGRFLCGQCGRPSNIEPFPARAEEVPAWGFKCPHCGAFGTAEGMAGNWGPHADDALAEGYSIFPVPAAGTGDPRETVEASDPLLTGQEAVEVACAADAVDYGGAEAQRISSAEAIERETRAGVLCRACGRRSVDDVNWVGEDLPCPLGAKCGAGLKPPVLGDFTGGPAMIPPQIVFDGDHEGGENLSYADRSGEEKEWPGFDKVEDPALYAMARDFVTKTHNNGVAELYTLLLAVAAPIPPGWGEKTFQKYRALTAEERDDAMAMLHGAGEAGPVYAVDPKVFEPLVTVPAGQWEDQRLVREGTIKPGEAADLMALAIKPPQPKASSVRLGFEAAKARVPRKDVPFPRRTLSAALWELGHDAFRAGMTDEDFGRGLARERHESPESTIDPAVFKIPTHQLRDEQVTEHLQRDIFQTSDSSLMLTVPRNIWHEAVKRLNRQNPVKFFPKEWPFGLGFVLAEFLAKRKEWGLEHDMSHTPGEWFNLMRSNFRQFGDDLAAGRPDLARQHLIHIANLAITAFDCSERRGFGLTAKSAPDMVNAHEQLSDQDGIGKGTDSRQEPGADAGGSGGGEGEQVGGEDQAASDDPPYDPDKEEAAGNIPFDRQVEDQDHTAYQALLDQHRKDRAAETADLLKRAANPPADPGSETAGQERPADA